MATSPITPEEQQILLSQLRDYRNALSSAIAYINALQTYAASLQANPNAVGRISAAWATWGVANVTKSQALLAQLTAEPPLSWG